MLENSTKVVCSNESVCYQVQVREVLKSIHLAGGGEAHGGIPLQTVKINLKETTGPTSAPRGSILKHMLSYCHWVGYTAPKEVNSQFSKLVLE